MSPARMPRDGDAAAEHEILWDPGVLGGGPVCELGGFAGAGDAVLLGLRALARRAEAAGCRVLWDRPQLRAAGPWNQAVVHLQKSRDATLQDVVTALSALPPAGELLVIGYNDLGIRSFGKQLDAKLGVAGRVRSNRRRGRVLAYPRAACRDLPAVANSTFDVPAPDGVVTLSAEPGVFSAGRLDPGSAALLGHLPVTAEPTRILDLGCGAGTLSVSALTRYPQAAALLLDADLRAVRSAQDNLATLGLGERARVTWWDAAEPLPDAGPFDLVLINPPFHTGKQVDLGPAFAMFEHAAGALSPDGCALIVANRTLPYEPALRRHGRLSTLEQPRGFKVLRLDRGPAG